MTGRYLGDLACPRCGTTFDEHAALFGCGRCARDGVGSNPQARYGPIDGPVVPIAGEPGIFRWRHLLPIDAASPVVSIGEGDTPLVPSERLAEMVGVGALHVKDESRNPTWSYKDRLAAVAVTKAIEMGSDTVVVSTTGNHGAAVAAYAAAAGLRCVVLTLASVPDTMRTLMQSYGAEVVAVARSSDRWTLMQEAVEAFGWTPMSNFRDPPVGSNPFGVDGYKTIAYEIVEQSGRVPDVVVVPTAYGDGLTGIWRGFGDLVAAGMAERVPRMVAAEPLGPYRATLDAGTDASEIVEARPSVAFSTASPVATHQGVSTLRRSGGWARACPDDDAVIEAQVTIARATGMYVEAASAVSFHVLGQLAAEGLVGRGQSVVLISTSSGLKDPGSTMSLLPEVPTIEPSLDALLAHLDRV